MQQPTGFPTAEQARAQQGLEQEIAPLKAIKKPSEVERKKLAEPGKATGRAARADQDHAGFDQDRATDDAGAAAGELAQ